jgi:hypothetical protein
MEKQPDAPQWEPLAEHSLKPVAEPLRPEHEPPALVSLGVQAAPPLAPILLEVQQPVREQLASRVAQPPKLPEPQPQASSPEAQPSQASPPEHAPRAALSDGALPGTQLPCAG